MCPPKKQIKTSDLNFSWKESTPIWRFDFQRESKAQRNEQASFPGKPSVSSKSIFIVRFGERMKLIQSSRS